MLSSEANKTIGLSNLKLSDKESLFADNVEPFSQMVTVSKTEKGSNEDVKQKISIFGVNNGSFLIQPVIQGRTFESKMKLLLKKVCLKKKGIL